MGSIDGLINGIVEWFLNECNGDWEHENQIKIETVSNPGWLVKIDLRNTSMENIKYEKNSVDKNDDWYFISIKDMQFLASGDMNKLGFILSEFLSLSK
jgi:hypothetical protein